MMNNKKVTRLASATLATLALTAPAISTVPVIIPQVALADVNDSGTVKTDKTKLNNIYGKVTNAHMDDNFYANYTPASVREMKETYANAGKVVNDNNATQSQIDQATGALEQAFNNMEKLVNDSQLTQEVEAAKKIDQSKYTASSVVYLRVAITSAEITAKSGTMTAEQRSNQYWALKAAEGYLVNKTSTNDTTKPNNDTNQYTNDELKQQLAALVNQSGNLNDSYSQQNFDSNYIFIQAKNYANTLTGSNVQVSNEDLKTAINYLTDAVAGRMDLVDSVKMSQAIDEANKLDQSLYSDSSAAVFKAAISNAQSALTNYQSYESFSYFKSPEAVPVKTMNRAYHNLLAAKANLVNKTDLDHAGHTEADRQSMLSAVKSSLAAAQAVDVTLYDDASVTTLKQAIKDANDLLNNTTPTYDQLNTANKNLTAAINGLKLKQTSTTTDKDGNKVTHNADGSTTTVATDGTTTTVFADGSKKVVDKNGNAKWYDAKGNLISNTATTPSTNNNNNNNNGNNSNSNTGSNPSDNTSSTNTNNEDNSDQDDNDSNDNNGIDPSDTAKKIGHEPDMKSVKTGINAKKDNRTLVGIISVAIAALASVGAILFKKKINKNH